MSTKLDAYIHTSTGLCFYQTRILCRSQAVAAVVVVRAVVVVVVVVVIAVVGLGGAGVVELK
jgi:hypothetical protein